MNLSSTLIQEMKSRSDVSTALNLSRFFKTGIGEYGYGDKFLGIKVPVTRTIVKKYKNNITKGDINPLIKSEWHEIRLLGFLFLIELFNDSMKLLNFSQAKKVA